MHIAMRLALGGLVCFVTSLALPAIQLQILGEPTSFLGWQASLWALGLGGSQLLQVFTERNMQNKEFILLGLLAVMNMVFVATPIILKYWLRRKALFFVGALSLSGLILGMVVPQIMNEIQPVIQLGYFVWLIGYGLLLASIILALKPAH